MQPPSAASVVGPWRVAKVGRTGLRPGEGSLTEGVVKCFAKRWDLLELGRRKGASTFARRKNETFAERKATMDEKTGGGGGGWERERGGSRFGNVGSAEERGRRRGIALDALRYRHGHRFSGPATESRGRLCGGDLRRRIARHALRYGGSGHLVGGLDWSRPRSRNRRLQSLIRPRGRVCPRLETGLGETEPRALHCGWHDRLAG